MLDDTLAKIKALKADLKKLDAAHAEKAGSVAGFADAAAHEAGRKERSPKRVRLALDGLTDAASELEATHPNLTATVAEICRELSSLGI
jgi:predicted phage gp36 major capsid-like protein